MDPAVPEADAAPPFVVNGAATPATPAEFAELFSGYARAARGTALKAKSKSDPFGEQLAEARALVYDQAADVVRQNTLTVAAGQLMHNASRTHVRTAPLMDFDNAGLQYISSRAWQFCALQIDPSMPEVAAKWD
jgi:hypothetical protein